MRPLSTRFCLRSYYLFLSGGGGGLDAKSCAEGAWTSCISVTSPQHKEQACLLFLLALSYLQNFTRDLPGRFERAIFFHRSNKPVLLHLASSKLDQWESYHCIVYIFPPHCSNVLTTKPKLYTFWRIAHQEALSTSSFFASTEQPMYLGTGSKLVVKSKGLCFEAVASYKALYNQYGFHKQYLQ